MSTLVTDGAIFLHLLLQHSPTSHKTVVKDLANPIKRFIFLFIFFISSSMVSLPKFSSLPLFYEFYILISSKFKKRQKD
ncbi:unnamed protein product [Meloidogyne enterolobii]|uniref:Uncharacterized protein n=1 Tax=Meloidogyne enterolobii TaxID=390850 RepID=A0ACB0ZFD0_MELEN